MSTLLWIFLSAVLIDALPQSKINNGECAENEFRCQSGICIDNFLVCDGAKNCNDGSDEVKSVCSKVSELCPTYSFKCAYGACIDRHLTCDGKSDCADNSDELLPECKNASSSLTTENTEKTCKKGFFKCDSGQCIDEQTVCDGKPDCRDSSDETVTECVNFWCPDFSFQCNYGACIDKDLLCDGKADCRDASDEHDEQCESQHGPSTTTQFPPIISTGPIPGGMCPLPAWPEGGKFVVMGCEPNSNTPKCKGLQGTPVEPTTLLQYSCSNGYKLSTGDDEFASSYCINGTWYPVEPITCRKLCKPLVSSSLNIECFYLGEKVNCSEPAQHKTIAKMRCKEHYHPADDSVALPDTECIEGRWTEDLYKCVPDCGKLILHSEQPLISYGTNAKVVEYPWHAGLYGLDKTKKMDAFCGGSIISPYMIITAAHCVFQGEAKRNPKDIKILVGKTTRDYEVHDPGQREYDVQEIITRREYRGRDAYFAFDIAILDLVDVMDLSSIILPVCIEWNPSTVLAPGTLGAVVGWGKTENGTQSTHLQVAKVPYIDQDVCLAESPYNFKPFITFDKFCTGYINGSGVQSGDSGGGLMFEKPSNGLYYIFGIVSIKFASMNTIAAFTNISTHIDFIVSTRKAIGPRHENGPKGTYVNT